jgi:hypothetical protein
MSANVSHILIFIWPLSIFLACLAMILMIEDYATSRAGYLTLPTAKLNTSGYVIFAVAALPQAGQLVLYQIWARDTKKGWAMLLAGIFFLADLGTDAWFKSNNSWSLMPLAIVESLFIFTLGSEVLFTIAIGFVVESFGDFVKALSATIRTIIDAIQNGLEMIGVGNTEETNNKQRQIR